LAEHHSALTRYRLPLGACLLELPCGNLEESAVRAMIDFRAVRAISILPSAGIEKAATLMNSCRVHLLFVKDEKRQVLGIVTGTDLHEERLAAAMREQDVARSGLVVAHVMTPADRLEALDFAEVSQAQLGRVVASLRASKRKHALVFDRDSTGRTVIRGLFAASYLARYIGEPV